jgi:hypothetical protein
MEKLKDEFTEMLNSVGNDFSEENLTALFPIEGKKYNHELMLVGRAFNGWGSENDDICWNPKSGNPSSETINNIIDYSLYGEKDGDCPMKWITDHWGWETNVNKNTPKNEQYNMKRSQFWRVTKEILSKLKNTEPEDWASYLVWSELYKIASSEGGNPSAKLLNAQWENCKRVLSEEIKFYEPTRILFLTGYDWFEDFEGIEVFKDLGFTKVETKSSLVEWAGYNENIKVVVAKHPQGKDETEYVKQVIEYFNK